MMTREEAIKIIEVAKAEVEWEAPLDYQIAFDFAIEALKQYAQREKGKWIIKDNPGTGWYRVTCSECGEDVTSVIPMIGFFPNAKALWDFCPDCGAEMREEQDG